jgi:hypothetical protein
MTDAMEIRRQMAAEGWHSHDRITTQGWGGSFGFSIWFHRSDWHGRRVDYAAATYHAHTADLAEAAQAVERAARNARLALHDYPDFPPCQGEKGVLYKVKDPLNG